VTSRLQRWGGGIKGMGNNANMLQSCWICQCTDNILLVDYISLIASLKRFLLGAQSRGIDGPSLPKLLDDLLIDMKRLSVE
jgi:hypothetical protein